MVLILFGSLFICLFLTVPIAISLAISTATVITTQYSDPSMMNMLSQSMVTSVDNYTLMAIPFFMLVGILLEKTGIAKSLIDVGEAITGSVAGGLGQAAILASMFFAAISGSGPAVVAAVGAIMIPAMSSRGYDGAYSGALVAASSTIGPVIPPSIPMIIYGATVGVSVSKLFMGGVIPGFMMGGSLLILNYIISKKRGYKGTPREGGFLWVAKRCKDGIWGILMPVVVLGGIYAGWFTPTEAAVIGVVYSILVGTFINKQLTLKKLFEAFLEASLLSATVMIVMGGATTFGRLLTLERIPEMLASSIMGLTDSLLVVMLLINLVLLVGGMFIDTVSNVILFAPLFVPVIQQLGGDVTYFGIVMTINLCLGMLTPPLGVNLFVAQTVVGCSLEAIIKQVIPFLTVLMVVLALVTIFPALSLWLPNLMGL